MSAAAAWVLLLGSVLVPLVLLWAGGRMHRRSLRAQTAFRGAALGFLASAVLVTMLLVAAPHHWPPASGLRLWSVALGTPVLSLVGAGLALLTQRR